MAISKEYESAMVSEIRGVFPSVESIAIWGGALRPDFNPEWGDVDLIIVLPGTHLEAAEVAPDVEKLTEKFSLDFNLEVFTTTRNQLAQVPPTFIREGANYLGHSMIQYQIKHHSKTIFGPGICEVVPEISLLEAVRSISHKIIAGLPVMQTDLIGLGTEALLNLNLTTFLVYARTLYVIERRQLSSKLEAIHYLRIEYPEHVTLLTALECLYRKESPPIVSGDEIVRFLEHVKSAMLSLGSEALA